MQVQVVIDAPRHDSDRLRDLATRRARFALRRMLGLSPRAYFRLSDGGGMRAGVNKRCQVRIETAAAGTVVAASTALEWRAAVDEALMRAVRRLLRLWRRRSYEAHRSPARSQC